MPAKKSKLVVTPDMEKLNAEIHRRQALEAARSAKVIVPRMKVDMPLDGIKRLMEETKRKFMPGIQASPRTKPCWLHEGQLCEVDVEASLANSHTRGELMVHYADCPECKQEALVNEKCRKWLLMGVPQRTALATFDNYIVAGDPKKIEVVKKVKTQVERGGGFLILVGSYGTGKTHLATSAFKELVKRKGQPGIFVTLGELVDMLRASYDEGGKEALVKRFQKTSVLVIDELEALGRGKGDEIQSGDIQPFLLRVLGYRYDRNLFTGLTSNEDLTKVLAILGPRLEDRMAQNYTTAAFTWESHRKKNRVR